MNNLVLWTVLVLVILYYRTVIAESDYKALEPIEFKDLKTGDIWCGRSDFARWPELWQARAFFALSDCVHGRKFSHCGVIYRDPNVLSSDQKPGGPNGLYVFMTQSVPYPDYDEMSIYPYGQSGTFIMPLAVALHQYTYNTITPIKKVVPDELFRGVMDHYDNLHKELANSAKDYAMIAGGYLFGMKPDSCKSLCTDHVSWILRDCGVVNINRPVVTIGDLYSNGGPAPFYFHFGKGQGLEKTRRIGWR